MVIDSKHIGLDTEGYGLEFGDRLFSIALSTQRVSHYFNFYDGPDYLGNYSPEITDINEFKELFKSLSEDESITWYIHNASHDLQKLSYEGIELAGNVVCTMVTERLLYNNYGPTEYSLDKCAKRRGWQKLDLVEECIAKNKLYTVKNIPGKKKRIKDKHFEKVPYELLSKYARQDSKLHLDIGLDQGRTLGVIDD